MFEAEINKSKYWQHSWPLMQSHFIYGTKSVLTLESLGAIERLIVLY